MLPENPNDPVQYQLIVGEFSEGLNQYLGKTLEITYSGSIFCVHCNRRTNKSFNQGYCYPCFKSLAQCDSCILKPEQCHFHHGTCREPEWAQEFCMQDHYVYLSNTSGVKVGITRGTQIPTRWIDQGATQALAVYRAKSRYVSGLIEHEFKALFNDKTNWRAMLKGNADDIDLKTLAADADRQMQLALDAIRDEHGIDAIATCDTAESISINYPVLEFPTKVVSANFDKTPVVAGVLKGIKGQYLILDTGVINLRKFGGYNVAIRV